MKTFASDGLNLAYLDVAPTTHDRAEPILLIHGFASSHATNWLHTQWIKTLTHAGRRVIALDNRGHGRSDRPHEAARYATQSMAGDALRLLDHLQIERADVMGYSMGARIAAFTALAAPQRVRSAVIAGLGYHLVQGVGLPLGIAAAMEAASLDDLTDPTERMFRAFAEQGKNDLVALAACIRGSRQTLTPADVRRIAVPTLIAVGTRDPIAGDPRPLAALIAGAEVFDIEGRDHNLAVGDRSFKAAVLDFLERRP